MRRAVGVALVVRQDEVRLCAPKFVHVLNLARTRDEGEYHPAVILDACQGGTG